MRSRLWLIATALLATTPATAQQFSAGYTFLKAVRDSDGAKATELLNKPGSGQVLLDTRDPATNGTALHIVTQRRDATWLNFMLARGARSDIRDNQGNTPLMIAAQLGWTDGAQLLLQRGASVDLASGNGETPLIRAVQNRDLAMVRTLLSAGANPAKTDAAAGLSARDYAKRDPRASLILKAIDDARPVKRVKIGPN